MLNLLSTGHRLAGLFALSACLLFPLSTSAQNPLFRAKAPRVFQSPDGLFQVHLPHGWQVTDFRPGESATLKPTGARAETQLIIQRIEVPEGAHPRLLRLKAVETRLGKLPGFKELAKGDARIDGYPAASITASYHYQGNIQYPRAIEEVFIVGDREAFILHFECFEPDGSGYVKAIATIYQSLKFRPQKPRQNKDKSQQKPPSPGDSGAFVDKVPY